MWTDGTLVSLGRFFRGLGAVRTLASGGIFPRRRLDLFGHNSAAAERRNRRAVRPSQNEHVGVQLQLVARRQPQFFPRLVYARLLLDRSPGMEEEGFGRTLL